MPGDKRLEVNFQTLYRCQYRKLCLRYMTIGFAYCMQEGVEIIINLIDSYTSLQRIKKADDTQKELDYQLKILKAKLELFGIVTTDGECDNV